MRARIFFLLLHGLLPAAFGIASVVLGYSGVGLARSSYLASSWAFQKNGLDVEIVYIRRIDGRAGDGAGDFR